MLKFDADLYRIAALCRSRKETPYYLQGVYVEPHAVKGVTMTATDGHKLLCVYDETGEADESAIVALSAEAMKACTPKRDARRVVVDGLSATVYSVTGDPEVATPVAISATCRVDGTFPDWRRVVPEPVQGAVVSGWYAFPNVQAFGEAAVALEKHFDCYSPATQGVFQIHGDASSPAVVVFSKVRSAFGVIMPVRGDKVDALPAWFTAKGKDSVAA